MKQIIIIALFMCSFQIAAAQNLGERYDWLKLSYKKVPLRANLPYYDTAVKFGDKYSRAKLEANARYFFENIIAADSIGLADNKISGRGTYTIYTNSAKDEEHTYVVNYLMDVTLEGDRYFIEMHDFNIYYLTNKVEFQAKYKHAEANDGKSNYFMALFNDKNNLQIKNLAKVLAGGSLPSEATAIK